MITHNVCFHGEIRKISALLSHEKHVLSGVIIGPIQHDAVHTALQYLIEGKKQKLTRPAILVIG